MNFKALVFTRILLVFIFLTFFHFSFAQPKNSQISTIDPPFWFIGMNEKNLQIIIQGKNMADYSVSVNYPNLLLLNTQTTDNKDYLILNLQLNENTKAGFVNFDLKKEKQNLSFKYELKNRNQSSNKTRGLNQSDLIYLITPDRFANGDTKNDSFNDMNETGVNRKAMYSRHGGDLRGIINKLDYINDLGITAIWLNPVFENNEKSQSYHGYAITDFYKVDKRFGTNEEYKEMVNKAHEKGIKVIKDVIYNHIGDQHYLFKNLISKNWINNWPQYTQSNYRATTLMDPYASEKDKNLMTNGWFDRHMPDLNQKDTILAKYLIQTAIWWIEEFDLDAYRIDTYAYPDQIFMKKWANAILKEYPNFSVFGETWVQGTTIQSYFTSQATNKSFDSELMAVTDFQMYYALQKAVNEKFGWAEGINAVYHTLVDDFVYQHPEKHVTFLDNHDVDRFFGVVNGDFQKFRMALNILFTTRGIPSIFYGTEILMKAKGEHGLIREDFLGGWKEDSINKFIEKGRTSAENEGYNYVKNLANWRKKSEAVKNGKLIHFVPNNGVYVYFRVSNNERIMVLVNTSEKNEKINFERFDEVLKGKRETINVLNNQKISLENLELNKMESLILSF